MAQLPISKKQALSWITAFYKKGGQDFDGWYGKQCMDEAVAYFYWLTGGTFRPTGNAIALTWQWLPDTFTRIKNVASTRPQAGDIVVWGYGSYSTYGHVGIVTNGDPDGNLMTFISLDQNWFNASLTHGSPPAYVKHNYSGVWGFIRPKFATASKAKQATSKAKEKVSQTINKVGSLEVGKVPPKKYTWSSKRLFKAKADSAGVTINARTGNAGNYKWNNTSMTYGAGTIFWVYEIMDGWCRIYNSSYNGWVWHERLRITSIDVKPTTKGGAKKKTPTKSTAKKDVTKPKAKATKGQNPLDTVKWINSKHITGKKITYNGKTIDKKDSVKGVVIHNDYGTMKPSDYENWLYLRESNGEYVNGWAAYYVNRNEVLYYHNIDYVEWHTGNSRGNYNYVGIEATESHPAAKLTKKEFEDNEEIAFAVAAKVLKMKDLPVNRSTVRLHREFIGTSCPHKSWDLHTGSANTDDNINKLKDYFIEKIKHYYNGGTLTKELSAPKESSSKGVPASIPNGYVKNSKGVLTKRERGRFIVGNSPVRVRTGASTKHKVTGILPAGYNGIIYDTAIIQNGFRWISYISNNGRRYIATGRADKNGKRLDYFGKFTTV
ncbi:CHAP domain-containing protein [Staphylococcus ureilyticus]|uniref:CHAP domain-containing protein n=1 Tax=Staphylococcus TaxID=1279 RepID=UPI0029777BDE|nr:CHAP domain-containing protein [Staphylococcus saprophyticus]